MSDEQKTEQPTQKRLTDSRKKGQAASSREVTNVLMIIAYTIIFAWILPIAARNITLSMKYLIVLPNQFIGADVINICSELLGNIFHNLALPMILIVITAILSNLSQNGFIFSVEPITPKLAKISPAKGLKRIFSSKSVVDLVSSIFKFLFISILLIIILKSEVLKITLFPTLSFAEALAVIHRITIKIMTGVIIIMGFIAILDLLYRKFIYMQEMKMSKQEVKDEAKQTEGNPEVKAKLRKMRTEITNLNINQVMQKADVVITNPEHFAVVLQYIAQSMPAPKVIAKGLNHVALKIKELAKKNNVEVVENKLLARALFYTTEVDKFIPEEHYKAVAAIISYVYKMRNKSIF